MSFEIVLNPNRSRKSQSPVPSPSLARARCRSRCSWVEEPNAGPRIRCRAFRSGLIRIAVRSRWVRREAGVPAFPGDALSTGHAHTWCVFVAGHCGSVSFPRRGMSFDRLHIPSASLRPVTLTYCMLHSCIRPGPFPIPAACARTRVAARGDAVLWCWTGAGFTCVPGAHVDTGAAV